jgi:hypothetical protein
MSTEFDEWAKRFESREVVAGYKDGLPQVEEIPPRCLYPMTEGPHQVAHGVPALHRSKDGYPVCKRHIKNEVRPAWRGYVEGA